MSRTHLKPYIYLAIALFIILSLPKAVSTTLRGKATLFLTPLWEGALIVKKWTCGTEKESAQLQENAVVLENALLKEEITKLQELLIAEIGLESDLAHLQILGSEGDKDSFFRRRFDEIQGLIDLKLNAVHAEVIFRGNATWTHTFQVNVGRKINEELGRTVIEKNSPVTLGCNLIGVVEEVYDHYSLVRLITDPNLHPSVRVSRGFLQNRDLIEHINALTLALKLRPGLLPLEKDQDTLLHNLEIFKKNVSQLLPGTALAKGELCGAIFPKWRSSGLILRGVGFNYDFSDQEGPSRDLRSGKAQNSKLSAVPLIQVGDLLVTTGMDGIFPPGLHVAEVLSIDILREGAYTYEIEARPTAPNLDDIKHVFILPSVNPI